MTINTPIAATIAGAPSAPRRVALVAAAGSYVGPSMARLLAARGHDLVVGDPEAGLVDELMAMGAAVEVVADPEPHHSDGASVQKRQGLRDHLE